MSSNTKQGVFPGGKDTSTGIYTPGLSVGDWVFVSGQGPIDPATKQFQLGSIEAETKLTLENVRSVLEEAGCTLGDVVKSTVHLKDIGDFDRFNKIYQTFFSKPYPTRTTVQSVLGAGISVEIDVIAIRGCSKQ
jgi:2-iminobutanoate/2-iminopropanoate deaminase